MAIDLQPVHSALLSWFESNRKDFPWRHTRDPYAIWISESMLQQTQVATVIPYYIRFIERFPTIFDLACSSLDDVLKLWEGLGYYSRARNLHRAAGIIANELGGQFPANVVQLRQLPGVGQYTAGAIASLAFDSDVPILDGNIIRVFARLLDFAEDVSLQMTVKKLWRVAEEWVPAGYAAHWNEGLMELGREICTPRVPACPDCPMSQYCLAFQHGTQNQRPVKAKKKTIPHFDVTAGVIFDNQGLILIARRPLGGLLGGLWEFPGGKQLENETLSDCLKRELIEELDIQVEVGVKVAMIRHTYTHFKITLHGFVCRHLSGDPVAIGCAEWKWVLPEDITRYAFPVTDQRIWKSFQEAHQLKFDWDQQAGQ
jgi:A/G-specific adenine glycosylase